MNLRLAARLLAVVIPLGVSALAPPAIAQTLPPAAEPFPARVRVRLPRCENPPFDAAEFLSVLRVELYTDGVSAVDAGAGTPGTGDSLADIALDAGDCAPGGPVVVRIDDAATRKQVSRTVDLLDASEGSRPRALALAVAELLRASWAELAMPDAPPPPRGVPSPVRAAVGARLSPPRAPTHAARSLGLSAEARVFPVFQDGSSVLYGARLAAEFALGETSVALRLDAGAAFGTVGDPLGQIGVGLATAGAGVVLSGGTDALRLGFGPRIEVGYGWVEGRAVDAATAMSSGAAPVILASVLGLARLRLATRVWATADLELGATVLGLVANAADRRAAGAAGPMAAFRLGIAMGL